MKNIILLLLIIFSCSLLGNDKECSNLLNYYEIDIKTKGYKGWMRVCNNDKINLYTKRPLSKEIEIEICKCFYYDYKDRDVTIKEK